MTTQEQIKDLENKITDLRELKNEADFETAQEIGEQIWSLRQHRIDLLRESGWPPDSSLCFVMLNGDEQMQEGAPDA